MTVKELERQGVSLTPKLTYQSTSPLDTETLATLRDHKADLLRDLTAPDSLPRLPWQLERLINAASSNVLGVELLGVPDVPRYTLAWAACYLTGDRDEALRRLWQVYSAWQGVN